MGATKPAQRSLCKYRSVIYEGHQLYTDYKLAFHNQRKNISGNLFTYTFFSDLKNHFHIETPLKIKDH